MDQILDHGGPVAPDNIHHRGWGAPDRQLAATLHFRNGDLPRKATSELRLVNIDGVEVYQETASGSETVESCELGWYQGDPGRPEKVVVYYHSKNRPGSVDAVCGKAREVAGALLPGLRSRATAFPERPGSGNREVSAAPPSECR